MMQKAWSLVRRVQPAFPAYALAILLSAGATLAPATASAQDEYDPTEAGHPLRIAAYILHPAGVVVDYLILRPAYYIGRYEPFRTLFGVTNP